MDREKKDPPDLLTIRQAAEKLNVSIWTLRLWDKKGLLVPIRIGSRKDRRYKLEDIERIAEKGMEEKK